MRQPRYDRFKDEKPILRDYLALDRTVLANERTALSYARTALALVVLGVSAIKFLDGWIEAAVGGVFIVTGVLVGAFGLYRFLQVQKRIDQAIVQSGGEKVAERSDPEKPDGS
ncbi:MAG: DUF202 domain-containing protein [Phycisphaeraceae bacterium]|nr:MAG: DUF202 domain-containing protein [Phycisphaeraceae bacterium]